MSRTRIVGGDIIKTTGGSYKVYSKDNIEISSNNQIIQKGEENGVTFNDPEDFELVESLKGVKVYARVFFDGTKNNRNNTFRRLDKDSESQTKDESSSIYKKTKQSESSYENGYSNIAAMSYMVKADKAKKEVVIYIEGIGTTDDQKGSTSGNALGAGKTGIPAKVDSAFPKIKKGTDKLYDSTEEYVSHFYLDVFGFSRGAAAARHFIDRRNELKASFPKAIIVVRFVGLFETVSSYEKEGMWGILGYDFENDVTELGLKLGDVPKKVLHLVAANEYRKNFASTDVRSAITAGTAYELVLPGVHSDIGGGYEEYEHIETRYLDENVLIDNKKLNYQELINQGWYKQEELEDEGTVDFKGTRRLKNSYQFVCLEIMMHFTKTYVDFEGFDESKRNQQFKVIPDLITIKNSLLNYAIENEGAVSKKITLSPEVLKKLRHRYLHISSNSRATGMGANKVSFWSNEVKRLIIHDDEG